MSKQQTFKTDKQEYLFQHPGIRFSEQMKDEAKDQNGKFMPHKYYEQIMKNVIVQPAVDYAFFDGLEGGNTEVFESGGTEFTFVYPETKVLSQMAYRFLDGKGLPSLVSTKEELMKHIIKLDDEPVTFDYFDKYGTVEQYTKVTDAASEFFQNTEFQEVMNAARRFLNGEEI